MSFDYTYTFLSSSSKETPSLVEAIKNTQKEGPYSIFDMNIEMLEEFLNEFHLDRTLGSHFLLMAKHEDDVIGYVASAMMDNHFMFANDKVAQIVTWWVHEDHRANGVGGELMKGVEMWAKEMGATRIMAGHYANKTGRQVKKMYEGNGYSLIEYTYLKEIK